MEEIAKHNASFSPGDAWKQYSFEELYWWVKLLTKRAGQRVLGDKRDKDLYDAKNYAAMLREYVKANLDNKSSHVVTDREQTCTQMENLIAAEMAKTPAPTTDLVK